MNKKVIPILIIIMMLSLFVNTLFSRSYMSGVVKIDKIPETLNEFIGLRNKISKTKQGGAALFITAMIIYTKNKELGLKCFTIAIDRSGLTKRKNVYKGFSPNNSFMYFIKRLKNKPYIPNAYIQGTNYKNAYKLPQKPYVVKYMDHRYSSFKVLIMTTSGNRPRPVSLRQNNRGIWKVYGASSLFVGLMYLPKNNIDDNL